MDNTLKVVVGAILALVAILAGIFLMQGDPTPDPLMSGHIAEDSMVSGSCTVIITDPDTGYTQTGFIDDNGVVHYV